MIILWLGGNRWVATEIARSLEWRHRPSYPLPSADVIVLASGGLLPKVAPRGSVELTRAGNRVLYASHLHRQGNANYILCTGGVVPGSNRKESHADTTIEFLLDLGVSEEAIWSESQSRNTYENALYSYPILKTKDVKTILLVTSASHMPRSLAVFRKTYSGIRVIPAPTDFTVTDDGDSHSIWQQLKGIFPSPGGFISISKSLHEYIGMIYYSYKGWM